MDARKAPYMRTHNWQQGFGLLYQDGKTVTPHPVVFSNRSFVVEGQQFSW